MDLAEAHRSREEAAWAHAEAQALAQKVAQLELADEARSRWFVETAVTRDRAHRARVELDRRGIDIDEPDDRTTAPDWLAAHNTEQAADDAVREIRDEAELVNEQHQQGLPVPQLRDPGPTELVEVAHPDIRELSVPDATEFTDPDDRSLIPSVEKTQEAVDRARDAITEFDQREADEQAHLDHATEADRFQELARWAAADREAESEAARDELVLD